MGCHIGLVRGQQWYHLSDPGAEEALYDIQSLRAFCHLELGRDPIPDETTTLNFRHLLETHGLTKAVFEAVADHLEARGALLRGVTIVDATLIAVSPSTKNAAGQRDPEMRSSRRATSERFIQTALREWAYARAYQNSHQRCAELPHWLHRYNWHRHMLAWRPKRPSAASVCPRATY